MKGEVAVAADQIETANLFRVSLNGRAMMMPIDSIVASMANQLATDASKVSPMLTFANIYAMYYNDVAEFANDFYGTNPHAAMSLFDGEWKAAYQQFKANKSQPFCKDLIVSFPDGSEWSIRAVDIATHRAETLYPHEADPPEEFFTERDKGLQDNEMLLEWASENLDWIDIRPFAEEIKRPQPEHDYEASWKTSPKRIELWDIALDGPNPDWMRNDPF